MIIGGIYIDLNTLLKICILIVIIGVGFKLLKFISSIIFKVALLAVAFLLVCKFFNIF